MYVCAKKYLKRNVHQKVEDFCLRVGRFPTVLEQELPAQHVVPKQGQKIRVGGHWKLDRTLGEGDSESGTK